MNAAQNARRWAIAEQKKAAAIQAENRKRRDAEKKSACIVALRGVIKQLESIPHMAETQTLAAVRAELQRLEAN